MNAIESDKKYIANTYNRAEVVFAKGKGSVLTDEKGKKYIDFGSGIAVNGVGICNKKVVKAVCRQAKKLAHASNLYYTKPQIELAKTLCERANMKKVFFSNSGAEANECAIKCARKYSFDKYGEGRYEIITLKNSFHGRTMATITATGQDVFHKSFNPFLEGFSYVMPNDTEELCNAVSGKTCAIMIEIVQGEGGVNPLSFEYVQKIAKMCIERDLLLIVDEVQSGNGRTGTLFAYQQYGVSPDVVTTAKGLGGGLPLGATLFSAKTESVLDCGSHGSTFGGNPIACAAAIEVLNAIDGELLSEIGKKSEYVVNALNGLKGVKSVSGLGLMLGVETEKAASEVVLSAREKGLILLTAKNKVRLLPALTISYKELDKGLKILSEVL